MEQHIQNTDELRQHLLTIWNELEQQIIDSAVNQWREIVWQPVCEKRVDILSTHSKNTSLGLTYIHIYD